MSGHCWFCLSFLVWQALHLYNTDHKALVQLMSSNVLNHRLQGWALKLQEFSFDIIYREGKLDSNADALSRQTWTPESPPVHSADSTKDGQELSEAGCGNSPT